MSWVMMRGRETDVDLRTATLRYATLPLLLTNPPTPNHFQWERRGGLQRSRVRVGGDSIRCTCMAPPVRDSYHDPSVGDPPHEPHREGNTRLLHGMSTVMKYYEKNEQEDDKQLLITPTTTTTTATQGHVRFGGDPLRGRAVRSLALVGGAQRTHGHERPRGGVREQPALLRDGDRGDRAGPLGRGDPPRGVRL